MIFAKWYKVVKEKLYTTRYKDDVRDLTRVKQTICGTNLTNSAFYAQLYRTDLDFKKRVDADCSTFVVSPEKIKLLCSVNKMAGYPVALETPAPLSLGGWLTLIHHLVQQSGLAVIANQSPSESGKLVYRNTPKRHKDDVPFIVNHRDPPPTLSVLSGLGGLIAFVLIFSMFQQKGFTPLSGSGWSFLAVSMLPVVMRLCWGVLTAMQRFSLSYLLGQSGVNSWTEAMLAEEPEWAMFRAAVVQYCTDEHGPNYEVPKGCYTMTELIKRATPVEVFHAILDKSILVSGMHKCKWEMDTEASMAMFSKHFGEHVRSHEAQVQADIAAARAAQVHVTL